MSEIRIKRLIGQNFLSVRQANISFENRGLVGVYGPNGCGKCLTGDTKISLVDGTERFIKDLLCKEDFYVYSYDFVNNRIVAGKAKARKTLKNAELVEIELDNGEKVKCTPDHKWLLRCGKYIEAKDLQPDDSLMPLYKDYRKTWAKGSPYERIYQPDSEKFEFTHHCFIEEKKNKKQTIRHHKNCNCRDNTPSNLTWTTWYEHRKLHCGEANVMKNPIVKEKHLKTMGARKKEASDIAIRLWKDPKYIENVNANLRRGENHPRAMLGKHHSENSKRAISENNACWNLGLTKETDNRVKLYSEKLKKPKSESHKLKLHKPKSEIGRAHIKKAAKEREQRKRLLHNHKVVSIKFLKEKQDCYDLEVEKYHNFALSAGVFVHNSALFVELFLYSVFGSLMRYQKDLGTPARIGDEEVVNRFFGKDCVAKAILDVEGNEVEITTYRQHSKFKNEVFFSVNGEDHRGASNDRTREKIVKLLDMDYVTVTNSVILGQSLADYFSGMKDEDQKKVVDRLLNMLWISQALEVVKMDLSGLENKIETQVRQLELIEAKLEGSVGKLRQLEEVSKVFEDNRNKRVTELQVSSLDFESKKEEKIKQLGHSIKTFEKERKVQIDELMKTIEGENLVDVKEPKIRVNKAKELTVRYRAQVTAEKQEFDAGVTEIRARKDGVSERKTTLDRELSALSKKVTTAEADIRHAETKIFEISLKIKGQQKASAEGYCEYCGSLITEETKKEFVSHLEGDLKGKQEILQELKKYLGQEEDAYDALEKASNEISSLVSELEKQLRDFQDKRDGSAQKALDVAIEEFNKTTRALSEAEATNKRVGERIDDCRKRIVEIQAGKNPYLDLIDKAKQEANPYGTMVKKALEEVNPNLELIANTEVELLNHNEQLKLNENSIKELTEEKPYLDFWVEGFSNRGLKSLIIESMIPRMNLWADAYSGMFGDKYQLTFSALKPLKSGEMREKFDVSVLNKMGAGNYRGNSGGERRLIDTIVMFVLGDLASSRSSKRFSCLILDEVFERLDEEICEKVIEVLELMVMPRDERPDEYKGLPERESIFVLTHQPFWKDKLESNIKVFRNENDETDYTERTTS